MFFSFVVPRSPPSEVNTAKRHTISSGAGRRSAVGTNGISKRVFTMSPSGSKPMPDDDARARPTCTCRSDRA